MLKTGLSDALHLTDLSDYIRPSQECAKMRPISGREAAPDAQAHSQVLRLEKDPETGAYFEVLPSGERVPAGSLSRSDVKISLADCLTCSGCTTTAESVLVNAQTVEEFVRLVRGDEGKDGDTPDSEDGVAACDSVAEEEGEGRVRLPLVVSIAQESVVSIANHFGMKSTRDAFGRLVTFFRDRFGASEVLHVNKAFYLECVTKEFLERMQAGPGAGSFPFLTSDCPGFVCYAEKTHGEFLLKNLSRTCSPQAIIGRVVKRQMFRGRPCLHVSVSMCFDKKLEASREDFQVPGGEIPETDMVLTSGEVLRLIDREGVKFPSVEIDHDFEVESFYSAAPIRTADYVFRAAARQLYSQEIQEVPWKRGRNADFQLASLSFGRGQRLRFAMVHGFRNIQTLIRKMKTSGCKFQFVEVCACPKGCLNGGGQIVPSAKDRVDPAKVFRGLQQLVETSMTEVLPSASASASSRWSQFSRVDTRTQYHDRRQDLQQQEEKSMMIEW